MNKKYWYVYKRFGGLPAFRHPSYQSAEAEAKRLVDTAGGEFEILEAVAIVSAAPKHLVQRLEDRDNDIPF
jgi:hypothetical protein